MLKRSLLAFALICHCGYAEEPNPFPVASSLANISALPSALVNNNVCAITGEFVDTQTDVALAGPEPLILQRSYSSARNPYGDKLLDQWSFNHPRIAISDHTLEKQFKVVADESFGSALLYEGKKAESVKLQKPKGLTNCLSEEISGRTNLKNQRISIYLDKKKIPETLEVVTPAGDVRRFKYEKRLDKEYKLLRYQMDSELKASGHLLSYGNNRIEAKDLNDNIYSWVEFKYSKNEIEVVTSQRKAIKYHFHKHKHDKEEKYYLTQVVRVDQPNETYVYTHKNDRNYMAVSRKTTGDRFLDIQYYKKGNNEGVNLEEKSPHIDKVKALLAPVGIDQTPIVTHRFIYEKEATHVYDAYNQRTTFKYDTSQRLLSEEKYLGTTLFSRTGYVWGSHQDEDNLIGSYQQDGNGTIHLAQFFNYDAAGNILQHKLYGNLTGNGSSVQLGTDNKPLENGCESYSRHFIYSQDRFHLLLVEIDQEGKSIYYAYQPNTDRVEAKYMVYQDKIRLRQFFEYNAQGVVVCSILDDGSVVDNKNDLTGVTERRITRITPSITPPVGVPEQIAEFYLDLKTGQEVLLKRQIATFNIDGKMKQQDHYDALGAFRYSLFWEYDFHGNVIKETNALDQTVVREYDENDNLTLEKHPSGDITKYTYDCSNRLIKMTELFADGIQFETIHSYNYLNQRTQTVDPFGNIIKFEYDILGRLIRTIGPTLSNDLPVINKENDIFGNVISLTDARGNTTHTTYTARGQPVILTYPDGTTERNEYNLNGSLHRKVEKNGTYTLFTYDYLGRTTLEELYSAEGMFLSQKSSVYNAFHLLSEIDPQGIATTYQYDGAGRLIAKETAGRQTRIEYDSLGRQHKEILGGIAKVKEYDLLNRVIEERTEGENLHLHTQYAYDIRGNRTHEIRYTQAGKSVTETQYNAQKHPIKLVDPLGNVTRIDYDYRSFQTTTTDPLGNVTILTHSPIGKLLSTIRKDRMGMILAHEEHAYDLAGNRIKSMQKAIAGGEQRNQVTTLWEYNSVNQLTRQIEAAGKTEQKITSYQYNDFGQKAITVKPDGVQLMQEHDAQGRLSKHWASDGSFCYQYAYDRGDHVTEARSDDHITKRSYDAFGAILSETLGNSHSLTYAYDSSGRLIQLTLPDASTVNYTHDAFLKSIERNGQTYRYHEYDLSGLLLKSQFGPLQVQTQYDLARRLTQIKTPQFSQTISYDAVGNIKKLNTQGLNTDYNYDALYQLSSETGHTYRFDSLHNRIEKDGNAYSVNALNQLTQQSNCHYRYDANGNLIEKLVEGHSVQYRYDALDRLIEVIDGSTTRFTYDAFNRRICKKTSNKTEDYLYQEQNEIGAVVNGDIVQLRILGTGRGAEIGAAVALELSHQTYIPIHDVQGSVACLLDASGNLVERYRYTAFGEEEIFDSSGNMIEASINPWRFVSKRHDDETGLIAFGRRYYAADIGRWITPDPIGYEDGPNLYAYVKNNPLTLFDLYGLEAVSAYEFRYSANKYENQYSYFPRHRYRPIKHYATFTNQRQAGARPPVIHCHWYENVLPGGHSKIWNYGELKSRDIGIGTVNGVGNGFRSYDDNNRPIADFAMGHRIDAVHNQTKWLFDPLECLMGLGYIATRPVHHLHTIWTNFFAQASPDAKYLVICHSQGAIHVRNALLSYPEHLRNRILVLAIAPAAYIDPKTCGQVWHYRAELSRDPIPYIDWAGAKRAEGTIITLKSHPSANWFDHAWLSPTYRKVISQRIENYINSNGALF